MSTLSGIASKGEKGKTRFQSLDINNLYSKSKGDPSETSQHKSTLSRRHGMQPLGKVPSARRPANLPSLKLEYSGNDPATSLVPSGGTGWGSKPGETGLPPTATQVPSTSTPPPPSATPTSSAPAVAAVPASTPSTSTPVAPTTIPTQSHVDKSWSSITSNSSEMFIGLQSPFFQHEFPSLSGDANASSGPGANKIDPIHLSGPSLRPQNEGNWIQGGSRPQGQMGAGAGNQQGTVPAPGPLSLPHLPQGLDVGGGRNSLGPSGVAVGPAGPMPPLVPFPHYNKLMPQFMLRHNMPPGGFPPNYQHGPQRPRFPYPPDTRFMPPTRGPPNVDQDEVTSRPIIKEEDLKVMDEIGRDTGWAAHDEIDYNQTLSFSDEEGALDDEHKGKTGRHQVPSKEKRDLDRKSPPVKDTSPPVDCNKGGRQIEEDEDLQEKRRLHNEHMAIAVEKARQRKEEEEKRYEESRQNAAKKLKSLEQRLRSKNGVEKEEVTNAPPQNVPHGSNALMPDWEKDRARKNSDERDDKTPKENLDSFRNTQMDNKSQFRERESANQHGFSRQFPSNVPPRLQKQAAENRASPYYRQNSGNSSGGSVPYDTRWSAPHFGGSMGVGKPYRTHQISESDKSDYSRDRDRSNNYDSGFEGRERERLSESPNRDRNKEENWKGSGYYEESSINVMNSHTYDTSSKKISEHHSEPDNFNSEKESNRFYDEKGSESMPDESFKPAHSFQDEPFVERDSTQDNKLEPEARDVPHRMDSRERLERPQRPESRESRASRDSFREDKLLEENCSHETMLPWSQSSHDTEHKEEKRRKDFKEEPETRRELHNMNIQHQRHIPGPITKEKLEALEQKCDSRTTNLVPLIKGEVKKNENKWEVEKNSEASWPRAPVPVMQPAHPETEPCTTQPPTDVNQESTNENQQLNINAEETKATVPKTTYNEREQYEASNSQKSEMQRGGRGGHRGMRHDSRGSKPGSSSCYRGGAPMRRGDRGQMSSNRRQHSGCDWIQHDPESEASDEVSASTESGKEDRRQDQERKHLSRSPRRGLRKPDRDDRSREGSRKQENEKNSYPGNESRRYDKKMYEHNRMGAGFEPSGMPTRRGRGVSFRSKGSSSSMGRGMVDGYGPPTSKKPFSDSVSSSSHEDKKSDGASQNQTIHKENGLSEMSNDEKMKLNQQQLSAGIIGNASRGGNSKSQFQSSSSRFPKDGDKGERKPRDNSGWGTHKGGSGSGGEVGDEEGETTSEQEDRSCGDDKQNENSRRNYNPGMTRGNNNRRQSSYRNFGRDKHNNASYDRDNSRRSGNHQSMVNGSTRFQSGKDQPVVEHSLADKKQPRPDHKEKRSNLDHIDLNNTASVVVVDDQPEVTVEEDQTVFATDNNGFQEVRSKKNVKEGNRQQKEEPQRGFKERPKHGKPPSSQSPGPPGSAVPTGKGGIRTGNLAPRFAKMKELSRQQKQQQTYDVNELNKMNQVLDFPSKDLTNPAPPPTVNAWDKPITTLHTSTPPTAESCNIEVADHLHSATSSQRSSPNEDKAVGKLPRESVEKALLDGTSPPVQTIIFENTNYKTAPVDMAMKAKYSKNQRPDKPREKKLEEDNIGGFKSPGPDIQLQEPKAEAIQMPISFSKNEDGADMKLDFRFDSELSQLTDDKTSKTISSIQMTRSIQMTTQSSTADLQFKLDSVKRVWENPVEPSGEDSNTVAAPPSYTPTFGNSVEEPGSYGKPNDPSVVVDENNTPVGVYNASQQLQANPNAYNGSSVPNMIKPDPTSNVCKVKPQPQSVMHPHAGPLSPPTGAFASPAQPSQHINYQVCHIQPPQAQYSGIPTIPSPPTVFTPSHEQQQLYQTFQLNNPQVLNNQARSQFSQFAPYMSQGMGQTSGFNQQSMYLHQTAPPPPTAAPAPAHPEIFSQFRLQPQAYGANQHSTTPNTMLISSSTVKPPPQPIGAIGSKAASYQTPSQPPSQPTQLIIYPDPQMISQGYLQNSQLVQRPASNVVPTIPPSSASYYSASTGGNAPGYFQPGNSSMHHIQAAFSGQSPAGSPAGMNSFGSRVSPPNIYKGMINYQDYFSKIPFNRKWEWWEAECSQLCTAATVQPHPELPQVLHVSAKCLNDSPAHDTTAAAAMRQCECATVPRPNPATSNIPAYRSTPSADTLHAFPTFNHCFHDCC